MKRIRTLQADLKAGKITKEQYLAELQKLLTEDFIDDTEHAEAAAFNPEEGKPIFTQDDVDRMVVTKAVKLVRKALKDAGVEVEASNQELLGKVAELAKTGTASDGKATDTDLAKLKTLESKVPGLAAKVKTLTIENAVLKFGGKLKPVNPAQVVRALADYMDLVDFDETEGTVEAKSVERALARMAANEPNLFAADDGSGEAAAAAAAAAAGYGGRAPGGAGGGPAAGGDKGAAKKLAEAREMLGTTKKE